MKYIQPHQAAKEWGEIECLGTLASDGPRGIGGMMTGRVKPNSSKNKPV
jgi:hypothetical protein